MFTPFIDQTMRHEITNFLVYLTQKCQNTDMIHCNPIGLNYSSWKLVWLANIPCWSEDDFTLQNSKTLKLCIQLSAQCAQYHTTPPPRDTKWYFIMYTPWTHRGNFPWPFPCIERLLWGVEVEFGPGGTSAAAGRSPPRRCCTGRCRRQTGKLPESWSCRSQ